MWYELEQAKIKDPRNHPQKIYAGRGCVTTVNTAHAWKCLSDKRTERLAGVRIAIK